MNHSMKRGAGLRRHHNRQRVAKRPERDHGAQWKCLRVTFRRALPFPRGIRARFDMRTTTQGLGVVENLAMCLCTNSNRLFMALQITRTKSTAFLICETLEWCCGRHMQQVSTLPNTLLCVAPAQLQVCVPQQWHRHGRAATIAHTTTTIHTLTIPSSRLRLPQQRLGGCTNIHLPAARKNVGRARC